MFTVAVLLLVEDTEKTTVAVTRNEQTASGGPEPNWNPGTTSTAPTQTETVSLVPDNLTKTMFLQTTTSTTTREPQLKMLQVRHTVTKGSR